MSSSTERTELVELGCRVEAIVVLNLSSREAIKAGEEAAYLASIG
ncbi:MAG: hypothetical protein QXU96_09210 [Ignisphaera sp.]